MIEKLVKSFADVWRKGTFSVCEGATERWAKKRREVINCLDTSVAKFYSVGKRQEE